MEETRDTWIIIVMIKKALAIFNSDFSVGSMTLL